MGVVQQELYYLVWADADEFWLQCHNTRKKKVSMIG